MFAGHGWLPGGPERGLAGTSGVRRARLRRTARLCPGSPRGPPGLAPLQAAWRTDTPLATAAPLLRSFPRRRRTRKGAAQKGLLHGAALWVSRFLGALPGVPAPLLRRPLWQDRLREGRAEKGLGSAALLQAPVFIRSAGAAARLLQTGFCAGPAQASAGRPRALRKRGRQPAEGWGYQCLGAEDGEGSSGTARSFDPDDQSAQARPGPLSWNRSQA
jgi:hypothetical protein